MKCSGVGPNSCSIQACIWQIAVIVSVNGMLSGILWSSYYELLNASDVVTTLEDR